MSEETSIQGAAAKENAWTRLDNRFNAKHPEIWKFVKWALAGFVANVPELGIQMACLYGFTALGMTASSLGIFSFMTSVVPENPKFNIAVVVYAYMLSTAVGYTIAFVLNRKATFHADSNIALSTFLYVLMVIFTIFANGLVVGPTISGLVAKLGMSTAVSEILSKLLCMAVPGLWTYPLNRFVIHRKKKEPAAPKEESAA